MVSLVEVFCNMHLRFAISFRESSSYDASGEETVVCSVTVGLFDKVQIDGAKSSST